MIKTGIYKWEEYFETGTIDSHWTTAQAGIIVSPGGATGYAAKLNPGSSSLIAELSILPSSSFAAVINFFDDLVIVGSDTTITNGVFIRDNVNFNFTIGLGTKYYVVKNTQTGQIIETNVPRRQGWHWGFFQHENPKMHLYIDSALGAEFSIPNRRNIASPIEMGAISNSGLVVDTFVFDQNIYITNFIGIGILGALGLYLLLNK